MKVNMSWRGGQGKKPKASTSPRSSIHTYASTCAFKKMYMWIFKIEYNF